MLRVLVTGANGQLGQCIQALANHYPALECVFVDRKDLDISNNDAVQDYFSNNNFEYCINCAAYTAVDQAEDTPDLAKQVNVNGAKHLAFACRAHEVILIHISTDFVFDGTAKAPYTEGDTTNPTSVYGQTKRDGELEITSHLPQHFIIRTSWLYSEFAGNFVKTIVRLAKEKDALHVVDDQTGSPTYAKDLAEVILQLVARQSKQFGTYHYSNQGAITWYAFAKAIVKQSKSEITLYKTDSKTFKTRAKRPTYSVLNTDKIHALLNIKPVQWETRLETCLNAITLKNQKDNGI